MLVALPRGCGMHILVSRASLSRETASREELARETIELELEISVVGYDRLCKLDVQPFYHKLFYK